MKITLILFFALYSILTAEDLELLYENQSSRAYELARVEIDSDGSVVVLTKHYQKEAHVYELRLNSLSMEHLGDLIKSSGFMSYDGGDGGGEKRYLHSGTTFLKVRMGKLENESKIGHEINLQPLINYISRAINQCEVDRRFHENEDIYSVYSAISPRASSVKLLNPELFEADIIEFIDSSDSRSKIAHGIEALQYLLTPEEFAGFLSQRLTIGGEENIWFYAINYGSLEEAHLDALMPLCLSILIELNDRQSMSSFEQNVFYSLLDVLGNNRYAAAIPFILSLERFLSLPYLDGSISVLSKMGEPALGDIHGMMKDKELNKRYLACELMLLSARLNPSAEYSAPVSREEFVRIKEYIEVHLLPLAASVQAESTGTMKTKIEKIISSTKVELNKGSESGSGKH